MKKGIIAMSLLVLVLAAFYGFTYFTVIPAVARGMLPYRWKSLVLRQQETDFFRYLGMPLHEKNGHAQWEVRKGKYLYRLDIDFSPTDSLSQKYTVTYEFRNRIFQASGVLLKDAVSNR